MEWAATMENILSRHSVIRKWLCTEVLMEIYQDGIHHTSLMMSSEAAEVFDHEQQHCSSLFSLLLSSLYSLG